MISQLPQILPKQNTDFVHFLLYQYFKLAFELSFIAWQKRKALPCQSTDRTHWSNGVFERSKCKLCMQQSGSKWQRSDPMASSRWRPRWLAIVCLCLESVLIITYKRRGISPAMACGSAEYSWKSITPQSSDAFSFFSFEADGATRNKPWHKHTHNTLTFNTVIWIYIRGGTARRKKLNRTVLHTRFGTC